MPYYDNISIPACEPDLPKWIWCLVANVAEYPRDDHFNVMKMLRRDTKHFTPGARVYVYPVQWGDGWERMVVVGKERGTHRYVRKVILGAMLEDFRLKKVYSPTIISWMCGERSWIKNHGNHLPCSLGDTFQGWTQSKTDKETIEKMVDSYDKYKADPENYLGRIAEQQRKRIEEAGRMKSDFRYGPAVYNSFVMPDSKDKDIFAIEAGARGILEARKQYTAKTLADLYDPDKDYLYPDLFRAHRELDAAVEAAYGVNFNGDEEKIVAHLFKLYAELTEGE